MNFIPTVKNDKSQSDLYSRLLEDRIILLSGEINETTSDLVTSQLLYLDSIEKADITIYINSPGGMVTAGMAIHDTMKLIKSDVVTICIGMAASMGAMLLASGTKGKRCITENAEVMIHQPLGGSQGQATDIEIAAKHILRTKERLTNLLSKYCDQPYDVIREKCERDYWMNAEEALEFKIVDYILDSESETETNSKSDN